MPTFLLWWSGRWGISDQGGRGEGQLRAAASMCWEMKTATSLFLVLFLFAICWISLHIINCFLLLCPHSPVPLELLLTAIILSHTCIHNDCFQGHRQGNFLVLQASTVASGYDRKEADRTWPGLSDPKHWKILTVKTLTLVPNLHKRISSLLLHLTLQFWQQGASS